MELAGSSLESQFAELEASSAQMEAEARLAALKSDGEDSLPSSSEPAQITDGDDVEAAFAALKAEKAQPTARPADPDRSSY